MDKQTVLTFVRDLRQYERDKRNTPNAYSARRAIRRNNNKRAYLSRVYEAMSDDDQTRAAMLYGKRARRNELYAQ